MTAYLNYAGVGRLNEPVRQAVRTALDEVLAAGAAEFPRLFPAREAARGAAARLLGCGPDEIAFVPNTSAGLQLVAGGMRWTPGDEVLVFDRDFPANVQPWRALQARGVRLRWIPMRDGGYDLADVAWALGPFTRLVAVSFVNFLTGFRLDLDGLCALAHDAGALVCVDAIQGLGALPLSLADTPVDFLAAGAHKWLCAPPGCGVFFCRRDRLDLLVDAPHGWFGYERASDVLVRGEGHFSYDLPPRGNARRFEGGTASWLSLVGLGAALDELEQVGIGAVSRRIRLLTGRLRNGLRDRGYQVLSPNGDVAWSGIVTFIHPDESSERVLAMLAERGVHLAHPDGKLRASPHYWTTDAEVTAFLETLPRVAGTTRTDG